MATERHNGGSSTAVLDAVTIELEPIPPKTDAAWPRRLHTGVRSLEDSPADRSPVVNDATLFDRNETLPSPTTASEQVETWKSPRINMYRLPVTFWSFVIMGLNDATYGAIIPYLENYYKLKYTVVSLIFLSPFLGYNLAAMLSNSIHMKLGQRGIAFLGPLCHLIPYIIIALHPPYPVLVVASFVAGFGNGLEESGWNAWVGVMANANELLGFLHGFYGVGATIAPLIATAMITKAGLPWYSWYYVLVGASALELVVSLHAFWGASGAKFREGNPRMSPAEGSRLREATMKSPAAGITWLTSIFLLCYVGAEVTLGGWVVTFMMRVRHGAAFASGITATGFYLGLTIGSFLLGFVTPRIGVKRAIAIYIPLAMAFELLVWLVPQFYVSAVAVAFEGFFLGPMFSTSIVACTQLLPKHLHISSIGFAASFGGCGGALFPFAVGASAQTHGVQVLQPVVLALLAVMWLSWMALPAIEMKRE